MIGVHDNPVEAFPTVHSALLAMIDSDLFALEKAGEKIDPSWVDRAIAAVHQLEEQTALSDHAATRELAHRIRVALGLIDSRKATLTPAALRVLRDAAVRLNEMIRSPQAHNLSDISGMIAALDSLYGEEASEPVRRVAPNLRILLVDDDSICRLLLETFLARYGQCHVAMNGREAVDAVRAASANGEHYDLICMDIRMPEMNGRDAVQHVRALEEADSSFRHSGAKIIMTTTVNDNQEVLHCFEVLCDAYLVKPIDLGELLNKMKAFQLVQ